MAHALWNYDGLCRNIHGHSYILQVTVMGEPIADLQSHKLGMVMDFGDLKAIVNQEIVRQHDHAIVMSHLIPKQQIENLSELSEKIIVVNYQPTCENLLVDFAHRIKNRLPKGVELFSLKLHETGNSFAEWYASDNE